MSSPSPDPVVGNGVPDDILDANPRLDSESNVNDSLGKREKDQDIETKGDKHREREKDKDREKSRDRERVRGREKSRDREKDKDREKSTDRERDRGGRGKSRDRERDKKMSRDRDWDRDRDRDRGSDHDRHRDRHRERRERSREIDDDYRHSSRDYDRYSRSSRSRTRARSHRRSHSRSKSTRIPRFDLPPSTSVLRGVTVPGLMPRFAGLVPDLFLNMFPLATGLFQGFPVEPVQEMTSQATKLARQIYVGGLTPTANKQSVATFFSSVMSAIGGIYAGRGDAVVNVNIINCGEKFAFVEMRTEEEASNAMALDGIIFEGTPVTVRRPTDYKPALGPTQPNPNLNLAAVGLSPVHLEGPYKIFVYGFPYDSTEVQLRELFESFGPLRCFDLVKGIKTGKSKDYAFCVYQDTTLTDLVCVALTGSKMGDKTLIVRRAIDRTQQPKPEQESNMYVQGHRALQKLFRPIGLVTRVICLLNCVNPANLKDEVAFSDILATIQQKGKKYGNLVKVVIPRPQAHGGPSPGLGRVFLEYFEEMAAKSARLQMHGKMFNGCPVSATYYPVDKYARGEYDE